MTGQSPLKTFGLTVSMTPFGRWQVKERDVILAVFLTEWQAHHYVATRSSYK